MAVVIKDIAHKAGVSEATVSLALNNSPLVNEDTAKRIKIIAKEMGYKPNPYARRLVLQRSGIIGVIVPDIENVFYSAFVNQLNIYCRNTNYSLAIYISGNNAENEQKIVDEIITMQVEGLIFVPVNVPNKNSGHIKKLENAEIPVVCATTAFGTLPYVMSDLENGMTLLVSHMLGTGHKKIAYISGPQHVFALDVREKGLRRALRAYGIDPAQIPYFFMESVTYQCAEIAAETILKEYSGNIDGIICVNDIMALGVINTLKQKNIKIPGEIAVAGFDDSIFSVTSPVPVTTVRQNVPEIAKKALEKLTQMIQKKERPSQNDIIPVELVARESTK